MSDVYQADCRHMLLTAASPDRGLLLLLLLLIADSPTLRHRCSFRV